MNLSKKRGEGKTFLVEVLECVKLSARREQGRSSDGSSWVY